MLDGASLPMGVLDSLVGRSTTFALDAGDWVVLVSDGALTDGSDWLMQQLQLCAKLGHTPKQAAETVADAAARRAGAKQDDITVAVLEYYAAGSTVDVTVMRQSTGNYEEKTFSVTLGAKNQ